jgi:hypothetical protein
VNTVVSPKAWRPVIRRLKGEATRASASIFAALAGPAVRVRPTAGERAAVSAAVSRVRRATVPPSHRLVRRDVALALCDPLIVAAPCRPRTLSAAPQPTGPASIWVPPRPLQMAGGRRTIGGGKGGWSGECWLNLASCPGSRHDGDPRNIANDNHKLGITAHHRGSWSRRRS